ncbi:hypothetical protein [Colwellia sp. PAMC 21821]|uniref:DUF6942 family protein n=1 Tax=Colwellia sp. PAMC 21821 TaxID=1816219 RepID=UPI0009BF657E|nr:hypothetical protein [Colwellia sp. PAMC 21821]ARD43432.1 hypothetical protein A3Q33_03380 [Colwellia sp. PAMC 21821]
MVNEVVGLGNNNAKIIFYIRNRPPLDVYQNLTCVKALVPNEIAHICQETGNHWRKIFNVYAKLLFELTPKQFTSWQKLRDEFLLQKHSDNCLLFSAPNLPVIRDNALKTTVSKTPNSAEFQPNKKLHVILGKGYAEQLGICNDCTWLSHDFAINIELGLIICPYFDYRQLSNIKITQLTGLIRQLTAAAV